MCGDTFDLRRVQILEGRQGRTGPPPPRLPSSSRHQVPDNWTRPEPVSPITRHTETRLVTTRDPDIKEFSFYPECSVI